MRTLKKRIWELKQSTNPDTLDMFIYGDVQGDYFDWWTWEQVESETSANHFRKELAKYPDVKQINIYINSYGGSVFEGTAIYSQLRRHPAQKTVYIDGFACSVASVIAMAGNKVIMPKNTMMMIHNMWNIVAGNATQLRKAADDLDVIMEGNRQAYLEKSGGKIAEEKLIELLEAETWLTADQCIEYGFADEILAKEADLTEAKQMLQKMNKTLEQHLSYNKALAAQFREITRQESQVNSRIDLDALRTKAVAKIQKLQEEEGPGLEDWLYLIHHIHIDSETGEETIHHCSMVDHLGNLYTVEHVTGEDGKIYHAITGLQEDQEIYWSDEEAEADGEEVPCANRQLES